MVTQEDTIFVSGMDPSISEEEICQHFGAIGIIKVSLIPYYVYTYHGSTRNTLYKQINKSNVF